MLNNFFKNKKVLVMGLGVLGRGAGDAEYLAWRGAIVTVTDLKTARELRPSLSRLKKYKIKYALGGHRAADFTKQDFILKNAGVPLDSPYVKLARQNKIPVEMDESLFTKLAPRGVRIIGVTGTRGKTTTTNLIYQILKAARKRVWLGGNIKGVATLPLLDKVRRGDYVVMELSSWQLQGFAEAGVSPEMAVLTNIYPDHLNYYRGDMKRYIEDKAAIFLHQKKMDYFITNKNNKDCRALAKRARSKVKFFNEIGISNNWKIKLLGAHNLENIRAAVAVGEALRISKAAIKKAVENFQGVPGRLEFIREIDGVKYYNDTTATTPEASLAAINSFPKKQDIILIAGGADKNLDYKILARVIKRRVKFVALLKGAATEKLKKELLKIKYWSFKEIRDMGQAVKIVRRVAGRGEVVLLSPAAASFGLFKNEYDRGDKFVKTISRI